MYHYGAMKIELNTTLADDLVVASPADEQAVRRASMYGKNSYPKPGMWVMSADEVRKPMLGRIRDVHSDGSIDVAIYSAAGDHLGRVSPAMGGPRSFEPCCGAENWIPIEPPDFELLSTKRYDYRDFLTPLVAKEV